MSEEEKDNSDKGERQNLIKNALNEHTNKKDLRLYKQERGKLIKIPGGKEYIVKFLSKFNLYPSASLIYACCKTCRRCAH